MDREEIVKIINNFLIEDIEAEPDKISETASLKDDIGIDSLDFVDIVVIVERHFGFKINPEEMAGVTTLGQFYDYIERKLGAK
jgi:acyl carrier protein